MADRIISIDITHLVTAALAGKVGADSSPLTKPPHLSDDAPSEARRDGGASPPRWVDS